MLCGNMNKQYMAKIIYRYKDKMETSIIINQGFDGRHEILVSGINNEGFPASGSTVRGPSETTSEAVQRLRDRMGISQQGSQPLESPL